MFRTTPLAGFALIFVGRFSGDHRGMIRWRAIRHTNRSGDSGDYHAIVAGTIVLTHTEPGLKEVVRFVLERNPDLQSIR